VLAATVDAAIEVTSAQRGVLFVKGGGTTEPSLGVAVARRVDLDMADRSYVELAQRIAATVIDTGEAMVIGDAEHDDRVRTERCVYSMHLKLLLCIPIHGENGTLGAIYLDGRDRRSGDMDAELRILSAFADQAAVALRTTGPANQQREPGAPANRSNHRREYSAIVGSSAPMRRVFDVLDRVAGSDVTVLIRGESGTGKELVAQAIHSNSPRKDGPFVAVNCAALPGTLLEAELFGYVRGAFTGAGKAHRGLFAAAHGGTLFLDELGEMSPQMQVKLLRVLQEREVKPLGSNDCVPIDVRLVCATNQPLRSQVARGRFRKELYYRVAVVEVELPALRDRRGDIPELANALIARAAKKHSKAFARLDLGAIAAITAHPWPGNVRQLENVLTRALLLKDGESIGVQDLGIKQAGRPAPPKFGSPDEERGELLRALSATDDNATEAARSLGMSRATFYRRLKRHGIARHGAFGGARSA
jgi:transcriptional regulator with GAF, ATPase, and Fis domain